MSIKDESQARIFDTNGRGLSETEWFRSLHTFHFGQFRPEGREPVGALYLLNEETVAGSKFLRFTIEEDSLMVFIPVAGTLSVTIPGDEEMLVNPGQVLVKTIPSGKELILSNPYESELINFYQTWFKIENGVDNINEINNIIDFSLDLDRNRIVTVVDKDIIRNTPLRISAGKFAGRTEALYELADPSRTVFFQLIQGAVEVQYRLLEEHDGLALWNTREIDIEALSNDAIFFLFEF